MKKNNLYDIEYFQKIKSAQQEQKRKSKRNRIIVLLIFSLIMLYLILPISKINDISVSNNKRYSEQQIMELAGVSKGQFSLLNPSFVIKNRLNKSGLFVEVNVDKELFSTLNIKVVETRLLFNKKIAGKYYFFDENKNQLRFDTATNKKYRAITPELIGKVDKDLRNKMIEKLNQLDDSIISEMSQIKYSPKSYDDEFFYFMMSGDKQIYIRASLNHLVKVGQNYHIFAANTKYKCSIIEYIDSESKAIVKKC